MTLTVIHKWWNSSRCDESRRVQRRAQWSQRDHCHRWMVRAFALLALFACRTEVQACAVCFGKSDSRLAVGMNWGIFTLLFFIGSVLAGLSFFFVFLAMRASRHPQRGVTETPAEISENPSHS